MISNVIVKSWLARLQLALILKNNDEFLVINRIKSRHIFNSPKIPVNSSIASDSYKSVDKHNAAATTWKKIIALQNFQPPTVSNRQLSSSSSSNGISPDNKKTSPSNSSSVSPPSEFSESSIGKYLEELPRKTFLNSLLLQLRKDPKIAVQEAFIREQINLKYSEALKAHSHLCVDARSRTHLQMASVVLAAYRVLLPWMQHDSLATMDAIKAPAGAAASTAVAAIQRFALWLSWDKFGYASRMLHSLEDDYGAAFQMEHFKTDTKHEVRISSCIYSSVFEAEEVPELTAIFCALDKMWFATLSPSSHGVEFSRPATIAEGAPACRFIVEKTEGP